MGGVVVNFKAGRCGRARWGSCPRPSEPQKFALSPPSGYCALSGHRPRPNLSPTVGSIARNERLSASLDASVSLCPCKTFYRLYDRLAYRPSTISTLLQRDHTIVTRQL